MLLQMMSVEIMEYCTLAGFITQPLTIKVRRHESETMCVPEAGSVSGLWLGGPEPL